MKKQTDIQIDQILKDTESNLSNIENSVRSALNSELSEKIHRIFELIFEAKTFALSLASSLFIFYLLFFSALLTNQKIAPEIIISILIIIYPLMRFIKSIKNKIR